MKKDEYDAIIIGAGIGGLVCGCYLAKVGMKVLIVEKNNKPGGYCTSFTIKGVKFDAFAHSLGGFAKDGPLHSICSTLGILGNLNIIRYSPSDVIISQDCRVSYWSSIDKTIEDFSTAFPEEKENIGYFFRKIIRKNNLKSVTAFRNKTFTNVLDETFHNNKLKNIFSLPILGNLGVPARNINAFTAIKHYKQFMTDGGYYPESGIQALPDTLSERFREFGGELLLSNKVNKIFVEHGVVKMIALRGRSRHLWSKIIISDCDARETYFRLIGREFLSQRIINKLNSMMPSLSLFVVYLALKEGTTKSFSDGANTWAIFDNNYDKIHFRGINYNSELIKWLMFRPNYKERNCMIIAQAPFKTREFWRKNKEKFMLKIIKKVQKIAPDLLQSVVFSHSMDPCAMSILTANYRGAGFGWASTNEQFMDSDFTRDRIINNLFLCGHWSTIGQGIEGVAITGERIASMIINRNVNKLK